MNPLITITWVGLTLLSCSNEQKHQKPTPPPEHISDSEADELVVARRKIGVPEPFDISRLDSKKGLDFTSGILSKQDFAPYCDPSDEGFYGRYYLQDPNSELAHPVVGTIDIFKAGANSGWKASDGSQKIWKIHLKSGVISVWDSIHIGLPQEKVVQFEDSRNGFCKQKESHSYACDFKNYLVVYKFSQDTLTELTITRNCEGENTGER